MSNNKYLTQQKATIKMLEDSLAKGVSKSTVVNMQKDYENDDQICLTSVVFISNEFSSKIISNVIAKLKKIEPQHYYYPPEAFHLTIKNVRTINKPKLFNNSDINKANNLFKNVIPKFSSFDFCVEDVLVFPTSLALMAYSDEDLKKLVNDLDKGLKQVGVPDNKKYFSNTVYWGNITFCRFTNKPSTHFINEVNKMRNLVIGSFKVKDINLITCNSVCSPKSRKIIGKYKLHN